MSTANFNMRMEINPRKIKENTARLTGSSLKGPANLHVGFGTIWNKLWLICCMKMLYFKALENKSMKAIKFLNAAKSEVFSHLKFTISDQIYVGIYTQGKQ